MIRFNRVRGMGALLSFLSALFILAACHPGGTEVGNPTVGSMTVGFSDDRQLELYLKEQFATAVVDESVIVDIADTPFSPNGISGEDPDARDHSGTTIQEFAVDESDKVKTDGSYLYVAQQNGIRVVKIEKDGAMSALTQVAAGGRVDSLYLYESLLVALYHPVEAEKGDWCAMAEAPAITSTGLMPCWIPTQAQTGVLIVDVRNPAKPVQLSDRVFDGSLVSSRRIGGKLHLVSRFMPELPLLDYYYDGTEAGEMEVVQKNLDSLKDFPLDDLLPSFEDRDAQGNLLRSGRLVSTEHFLRPLLPQGGSIVTVLTFDLDDPDAAIQSMGAVLDARHLYASTAALYLAAESRADDGSMKTALHKFDLGGEKAAYAAGGTIPGSILNQFSLGEYEGVLRVATATQSERTDVVRVNQVYCLAQRGETLEIVGRLEELALGARLYAARFMGTRGFLVTFDTIDPLFTLDLSEPTDPKVIGELKVPGYIDYIHPLGDDLLLTLGKRTLPDGDSVYDQGLQLSIFDIGDFANPDLLFREEIGDRGTDSEALHDHKALTYWAANGLLTIPVDLYQHLSAPESPSAYGKPAFAGLYVYRIHRESGITPLGRIGTQETAKGLPYSLWTRGLFVAGSVYAVTGSGVFSADLTDIENTVTTLDIGP